jgi:dinuclear metal center YbgI/SA1388 family protein
MAERDEIVAYLDEELEIHGVEDQALNGLQVQGDAQVDRVALATDAALAVYRHASGMGAEMILVHHGILWSRLEPLTGVTYEHVRFLIENDINLYAAHLPLDLHPVMGNNALLARMAGIEEPRPFGRYHGRDIGFMGELPGALTLNDLCARWREGIGGEPLVLPFGPECSRSIGIVSGGGSFGLNEAIERKLDCFVTGEGEHWNHHLALEAGINVVYLGHYESETPGVRAVGEALAARFGVKTMFIDEPTLI